MLKVAVITRTKDRPQYLRRAIESVASQTYSDYQHVIVNDGGDKAEVENILNSFEKSVTNKIKLFHRAKPSNAPDTIFNESIDRVNSEYFAIHDDDDTWHSKFLATTVKQLDENQDLGAVVVRTDKIIEELRTSGIYEKSRVQLMPDVRAINLYRQCIDNQLTPIATLFRRSAYDATGKFDSSLAVVGDWEFGVRLLMKYNVDFIDPGYALANYHHRLQADNSFAAHDHRYYTNKVMNKYLRQELADGRLGAGYIMSKERYQQHYISGLARKIMPKFVSSKLRKRASK